MAQFCVYVNLNPGSRDRFPYLLDVQAPLLEALETRLVIPLISETRPGSSALKNLTPSLEVEGSRFLGLTPQMAAVPKTMLGAVAADLSFCREEILAAIDFLVTGF